MANLTTKELTALDDQMGQEQTLIKKYQSMAAMCSDPEIKREFNDIAKKHQQHYDTLMTFL